LKLGDLNGWMYFCKIVYNNGRLANESLEFKD